MSDEGFHEDWLRHDGGEMPVSGSRLVRVRLRKGDTSGVGKAIIWASQWKHRGSPFDIIAYAKAKGQQP